MAERIGVFRANDARKIAAGYKALAGMPGLKLGAGHRVPITGGGGPGSTTSGDPSTIVSSEDCMCGLCIDGVNIPDANPVTGCCRSHLEWTLVNPWLQNDAVGQTLILEYIGGDTWLTETFTATSHNDPNVYRWQMEVDTLERSYLRLVLVTDNGGPTICIEYARDSFDCQCQNNFHINKPYGKFVGVERNGLLCNACVKPAYTSLDGPPAVGTFGCGDCGTDTYLVDATAHVKFDGGVADDFFSGCNNVSGVHTLVESITADIQGLPTCGTNRDVPTQLVGGGTTLPGYCTFFKLGECEEIDGFGLILGGNTCANASPFDNDYQLLWAHGVSITASLHTTLSTATVVARHFGGGRIRQIATYISDTWDCATQDVVVLTKVADVPCGDTETECCNSVPGATGSKYHCTYPDTCTLYLNGSLIPSVLSPTSTGACADTCLTEPAPPDTDNGGCALSGTCFDQWSQSLCSDFGGTWHPNGCEDYEFEQACCIDNFCIDTDVFNCNAIGGTMSLGALCADNPCAGACCRADETCVMTSEADCQGAGEYWHGNGSTCTGRDCGMTACCSGPATPPGECVCSDSTLAGCTGPQRLGPGTTCATADLECGNNPVDCGWF